MMILENHNIVWLYMYVEEDISNMIFLHAVYIESP